MKGCVLQRDKKQENGFDKAFLDGVVMWGTLKELS